MGSNNNTAAHSQISTATPRTQSCMECVVGMEVSAIPPSYTGIYGYVHSRLDYCGSISAGLPWVRMKRLRRVQRAAAPLIGRVSNTAQIFQFYEGGIMLTPILTTHPIHDRVLGAAVLIWLGAHLSA